MPLLRPRRGYSQFSVFHPFFLCFDWLIDFILVYKWQKIIKILAQYIYSHTHSLHLCKCIAKRVSTELTRTDIDMHPCHLRSCVIIWFSILFEYGCYVFIFMCCSTYLLCFMHLLNVTLGTAVNNHLFCCYCDMQITYCFPYIHGRYITFFRACGEYSTT